MNKNRRKELESISAELEALKERLETTREEEQEAYDNMPEGLQESERGELMYGYIDDMDNGISDLESLVDSLNEIIES